MGKDGFPTKPGFKPASNQMNVKANVGWRSGKKTTERVSAEKNQGQPDSSSEVNKKGSDKGSRNGIGNGNGNHYGLSAKKQRIHIDGIGDLKQDSASEQKKPKPSSQKAQNGTATYSTESGMGEESRLVRSRQTNESEINNEIENPSAEPSRQIEKKAPKNDEDKANKTESVIQEKSQPQESGNIFERTLRACYSSIAVVGFFSVLVNILMLTTAFYLFQISDTVLSSQNMNTLIMLSLVAVLALVAYGIFDYVRRIMLIRMGNKIETSLGAAVMMATLNDRKSSPEDIQALRDLDQVKNFSTGQVFLQIFDAILSPLYIIVVYFFHPILALVLVIGWILLFLMALINQALTSNAQQQAAEKKKAAFGKAQNHVQNLQIVQAMGMGRHSVAHWGRENYDALSAQMRAGDRNAFITSSSATMRLLIQIALLGVGAYLTLLQETTAGAAIAASIIGGRALQPVQGAIEGWKQYILAKASFFRLKDHLKDYDPSSADRMKLGRPKGKISIEGVTYMLPKMQQPLINNANFSLDQGSTLAILGPSGCGKSTLAKIIAGVIIPPRGNVYIGGHPVQNWNSEELGRYIGYLPQEGQLMPGTVLENIARMDSDPDKEAVLSAARASGAEPLIGKLPDGFSTQLGLNGAPLSGGQRQQVALARAFYGKPSLLILDEPDASLDHVGTQALLKGIEVARQHGVTTIVVTHKPRTAEFAQKWLYLDQGGIVAFGDKDKVKEKLKTR